MPGCEYPRWGQVGPIGTCQRCPRAYLVVYTDYAMAVVILDSVSSIRRRRNNPFGLIFEGDGLWQRGTIQSRFPFGCWRE